MDKKITDILDYKSSKVEADKIKINEVLNKELLKFQFEEDYLKEGDLSIENASVITFHSCIIENYTDTRTIKESNRPNHSGINQKRKNVSEFNVWDYELSFSKEFQNTTDSHEILDSHHALGCSTCRQRGTLRCSNCNGGGEVTCSNCSGIGENKCSNCNGRVNIRCWSCSGKGIIEKGYGENKVTERCSRCYGQGSKKCSRCSNGYITCSNCSGRGKVTCRTCEGSGEVTCYNCEGYGTMDHYYIVSANFINLSQRLILTTPYSGFDYDKAKSNNFNIRNKLFEIQKTKFEEKHFDEIKSSSFYSQITSFFDFKDNESTRLITSRITVFENKYFEVTFSFYGEKYKFFLDKNFENSYYDGKKPSEQYELDLLKKSIESSVKNELATTKKTIHKLSKYDFIDISEKEIINAIEDTQNIYKAFSEYKSKKYSSAERVLKLVSNKKTKEYDFKLLRKKLNLVYNMNTIIFWIISILPLYYFLYNTSINYIIRNTLFTIIILIFSILINKYLKNIRLSRFLVVLLIIVQFIFINIIHTPESRILACDCWEQSVDKSGMAYDNMTSKQQIFREKCFDIFKNETSMKNACEYFPVENLQNKKKNNEEKKGETEKEKTNFKEVTIGNQVWMKQNLNVSKFRNGDTIPHAKTDEDWEEAGKNKQPAWCYYDNDPTNEEIYGKLYNWYAVNDPRGLAPEGWKIPSDEDWARMIDFLGDESVVGKKMKSTAFWADAYGEAGNATNESEFSGLPGGSRLGSGSFYFVGEYGYWWSSWENNTNNAWGVSLYYNNGVVSWGAFSKTSGSSVRCLAGSINLYPKPKKVTYNSDKINNDNKSKPEIAINEYDRFTIQAGSYTNETNAKDFASKLSKDYKIKDIKIDKADVNEKTVYRVNIGLFDNTKLASDFEKTLPKSVKNTFIKRIVVKE